MASEKNNLIANTAEVAKDIALRTVGIRPLSLWTEDAKEYIRRNNGKYKVRTVGAYMVLWALQQALPALMAVGEDKTENKDTIANRLAMLPAFMLDTVGAGLKFAFPLAWPLINAGEQTIVKTVKTVSSRLRHASTN